MALDRFSISVSFVVNIIFEFMLFIVDVLLRR